VRGSCDRVVIGWRLWCGASLAKWLLPCQSGDARLTENFGNAWSKARKFYPQDSFEVSWQQKGAGSRASCSDSAPINRLFHQFQFRLNQSYPSSPPLLLPGDECGPLEGRVHHPF